jgi:phosphonate transport system substrate-binding protein
MRLASLAAGLIAACTLLCQPARAETTELNFGIISTESSTALKQQWTPFLDDMEKATGLKIHAFFAPDYAGIIEGMRFNKVQVAYFGNKSAMEAVDRAEGEIFAQVVNANGLPGYYSLLITHKDSGINSLDDILKHPGQYRFGNGDPNSTSGFLVPSYYVFAKNNVEPKALFKNVVTGSHETNLMAVMNKQVDVATNNNVDMEKVGTRMPDRIGDIKVIWKSPLIPADPIVWRKDLPADIKAKVRNFLLAYGQGDTPAKLQERKVLAPLTWVGFKASGNDQLLPIRQLEMFKQRTKIAGDENLAADQKKMQLAEIDKKLAELQKASAGK